VGVDDLAHAAPAEAPPAGAVADGGDQGQAEHVRPAGSPLLEVHLQGRSDVIAQVDQAVVALAADQQRPMVAAELEVVDIGARDLDRPQHLQAEQRQQRLIAQVWGYRLGCQALVACTW
jgi:hypothetical protein